MRLARCVLPTMRAVPTGRTMVPKPPAADGGRVAKHRARRRAMRATHGMKTTFVLSFGLALIVGALVGGAGVWAQEDRPMTAAQTQETMEGYAEALLGGGAYEVFFADDVVVTMTGVDQEIRGPEAAKAAIDAIHHEQFDAQPEVVTLVVGEGQAAIEAVF